MSCPETVSTYPVKGCESATSKMMTDGYKWDTGESVECYDTDPVTIRHPRYDATNILKQLQVRQFMRWHKDTISRGTKPFALYADFGGDWKWYVVKLINTNVGFDYEFQEWRKLKLEVHILGYANTVVEPILPSPILCDDGSVMKGSDGCDMWCVAEAGTATDIVCL